MIRKTEQIYWFLVKISNRGRSLHKKTLNSFKHHCSKSGGISISGYSPFIRFIISSAS